MTVSVSQIRGWSPARLAPPAPAWTAAICVLAAMGTFEVARLTVASSKLGLLATAALTLMLLIRVPRALVVTLLVLACTIRYSPLKEFGFGGIHSDEVELLAFGLIGIWVLKASLRELDGISRWYLAPCAVLVLAMGVQAFYAFTHGVGRTQVVGNAKAFVLYLLVLPLCEFFAWRRQAQLERIILWVATVGSIVVLAAVVLRIQLEGRPGVGIDANDLADSTRLRPALMPVLFLATLLVVGQVSAKGLTLLRGIMLSIFTGLWAVTYNRSTWVALAIACGLLLVVRPGRRRVRRTIASLLGVCTLTPVLYLAAADGALGPFAQTVAVRADSIFSGAVLKSGSYTDRAAEYSDAFHALGHQPVFGVGIGGLYGARRIVWNPNLGVLEYVSRNFTHNSWVYLALQLGLLGLIAFVLFVRQAWRGIRANRELGTFDQSLRATSAGCALVGMLLEALFNPNLLVRPNIIAFAVALALVAPALATELTRSRDG